MKLLPTKELGCVGHCIVGRYCQWRRHTQVGTKYRVSTIGLYYVKDVLTSLSGLAPDFYFESMVFETADKPVDDSEGCGCLEVVAWSEIDANRYKTAAEAQRGHEALVEKYVNEITDTSQS